MTGIKSTLDAPVFSVYESSLDLAIHKAKAEFGNDRWSSAPRFKGYDGFELRTVRVTPEDYDPDTIEFVFAVYK